MEVLLGGVLSCGFVQTLSSDNVLKDSQFIGSAGGNSVDKYTLSLSSSNFFIQPIVTYITTMNIFYNRVKIVNIKSGRIFIHHRVF